MSETIQPEKLMRKAIGLAEKSSYSCSPRPAVGCVLITKKGEMFEGRTEGREGRHAERAAIEAAGNESVGAEIFTTLEPCVHHGKTPPCADFIIESGVARVNLAILDSDSRVSGKGVEKLKAAGVEVTAGICEKEVQEQLEAYLKHRRSGSPFVILKMAMTLDGQIAAVDGSSQWITGPEARADAHRLRAQSDAILVGAETVRRDDPRLTVRDFEPADVDILEPLRIVLGACPPKAKIMPAKEVNGELPEILEKLGKEGILQLLVEGGSKTAWQFHNLGLVDKYVLYLSPSFMGGSDGKPLFSGPGAETMQNIRNGEIRAIEKLGSDMRIDLKITKNRH